MVKIRNKVKSLKAGEEIEVLCATFGSVPAPDITWKIGGESRIGSKAEVGP